MPYPRAVTRHRLSAVIAAAMLGTACTAIPPTTTGAKSPDAVAAGVSSKTLLAIYMIGSDLEDDINPRNTKSDEEDHGGLSKVGAGSDDLKEIIAGYNALSAAEKANVDVLVAFGGSRKQGWKGIKYADIGMLIEDAKDDYFGNLPQYLDADAKANLNNQDVYQKFLTTVKGRAASENSKRVFLDMWDHGAAYLGMGPDKNPGGGMLRLPVIKSALEATQTRVDILGFDACLMASVEVASAVRSAARYMVASEELEPGHGWDYALLIKTLGRRAGLPMVDVAKSVVDDYMDSPAHRGSNGRTLSVTDLSKVEGVNRALDGLAGLSGSSIATTYPFLLKAVNAAQHFGKANKDSAEYTVDLRNMSEILAKQFPSGAQGASSLAASVKDAIIYARDDGTKPQSLGMSIFSLNNLNFYERNSYTANLSATPTWFSLVSAFMSRGSHDTSKPTISGDFSAKAEGSGDQVLTIVDDIGIQSVKAMHVTRGAYASTFGPTQAGQYMVVSSEDEAAPADTPDSYTLPKWDGMALTLTSGGQSLMVPVDAEGLTENGNMLYSADTLANGTTAMLYLEWNKTTNQVVDYWLVPYVVNEDEEVILEKDQYILSSGDKVAFGYHFLESPTAEETWEFGPVITLSGDPTWSRIPASGTPSYFTLVQDLKGNQNSSVPRPVTPSP